MKALEKLLHFAPLLALPAPYVAIMLTVILRYKDRREKRLKEQQEKQQEQQKENGAYPPRKDRHRRL